MSRLWIWGAAAGVVLGLTCGAAGAAKKSASVNPRFPFPSGKVTYKLTSAMGNGTSVLSWIEGGRKFRQDSKFVAGRGERKTPLDSWAFFDGAYLFSHQPMMGKNVYRNKLKKGGTGLGMGLPLISGGNFGKVVGKGAVLGKPCEVRQAKVQVGTLKIWTWKNLPLKLHVEPSSDSAPAVDVVATAVQAPAAVAASQFKLPAGYTVVGPGTGAGGRMGARPGKPGVVPVQ